MSAGGVGSARDGTGDSPPTRRLGARTDAAGTTLALLRTIVRHPLNQDRPGQALTRWLRWHLASRIAPGPIAVPFVEPTRLLMRPGDRGLTLNHYLGLAEFAEMGFALHYLEPDDLFVDVGANAGAYTVLASGAAGARSIACEPDPDAIDRRRDNVALNGLGGRVELHETAVGATIGAIAVTRRYGPMNQVAATPDRNAVLAPLTTLDAILAGFGLDQGALRAARTQARAGDRSAPAGQPRLRARSRRGAGPYRPGAPTPGRRADSVSSSQEAFGRPAHKVRSFPEYRAGGFSRVDTRVGFYSRVAALLRPEMTVLKFGAGRGLYASDPIPYRRELSRLRGKVARVVGVDIDPVVTTNPDLDEAHVLPLSADGAIKLPLDDGAVDLIVSSFVFEHVENPQAVVSELHRVLRPGGWLCALTPNRWGYIGLGNRLVPERLKSRLMWTLQPQREAEDVLPTHYRLNDRRALRRAFPAEQWVDASSTHDPEPAYTGSSVALWRLGLAVAAVTPPALRAMWLVFLQRRAR